GPGQFMRGDESGESGADDDRVGAGAVPVWTNDRCPGVRCHWNSSPTPLSLSPAHGPAHRAHMPDGLEPIRHTRSYLPVQASIADSARNRLAAQRAEAQPLRGRLTAQGAEAQPLSVCSSPSAAAENDSSVVVGSIGTSSPSALGELPRKDSLSAARLTACSASAIRDSRMW